MASGVSVVRCGNWANDKCQRPEYSHSVSLARVWLNPKSERALHRFPWQIFALVTLAVSRRQLSAQTEQPRPLGRAEYDALVRGEQEATYASLPFLVFGLPRERSRNGDLPILYEATVAPPLILAAGRKPLLIAVTPKIVVRQYYGGSYPVPPPSFMPRISAYWWGWPYAPRRQIDSAVYGFLRLGHHSNGQEERFYDSTSPPPFAINYKNGDFFTNYLEAGIMRRFFSGPVQGSQQISFEWHPEGWMAKAMRPIYGRYRAHLNTNIQLAPKALRPVYGVELSLGYIGGSLLPERRDVRDRTTIGLRVLLDIGKVGDFQPFASYYTGQDYYNIRFDRNISVIQIGAIAGARRLSQAGADPQTRN